jgi:hypothetical protein
MVKVFGTAGHSGGADPGLRARRARGSGDGDHDAGVPSVEHQLVEVATQFLEDLYERTRETVHLGVRRNLDVVYIARIGGHGFAAEVDRGLAPRGRTHTITDAGALAVQLAEIAESGIVRERMVAAISIAGPPYRFSPELHRTTIKAAADAIGGLLAVRITRPAGLEPEDQGRFGAETVR